MRLYVPISVGVDAKMIQGELCAMGFGFSFVGKIRVVDLAIQTRYAQAFSIKFSPSSNSTTVILVI